MIQQNPEHCSLKNLKTYQNCWVLACLYMSLHQAPHLGVSPQWGSSWLLVVNLADKPTFSFGMFWQFRRKPLYFYIILHNSTYFYISDISLLSR
jgi:hypothetical protein